MKASYYVRPFELLTAPVGGDVPLRVGMLVEIRKDGLAYPHSTPGGLHQNIFVANARFTGHEVDAYEPGEECWMIRVRRSGLEIDALLAQGEKVWNGDYLHGSTIGTDLISAGNGLLQAATRLVNPASTVGQALETVDLRNAEEARTIKVGSVYLRSAFSD